MTELTRVAGSGSLADGSAATWTVAEGRKGRRWREVVTRGTTVIHALMLETDRDGRFSHLELAREDGLWTFHPEGDRTLHGNHVGRREPGVRHFGGWPFSLDDALIVEGSPISLAALTWRWARSIGEGGVIDLAGVVVGSGDQLDRVGSIRVGRLAGTRWQVGEGRPFEIDQAGLPVLKGGHTWPLELA